jgi:hypothetical protein
MQQRDSTFKFVQMWNDQPLNTHHDIIVSADYAFYNYNDTPTCGFCLAFFETLTEKPRGGGPAYSLAYLPSEINTECSEEGYFGLEAALYAVAFDANGIFAKKTNIYDGVEYTVSNSICVRKGIRDNYSFIKQSPNLQYSNNFKISQQLTSLNEEILYKQVRVVFSKCMSSLEVQVKNENEREFKTALWINDLPIMERRSIKAALFYTSLDQDSRFLLRQFNVAGYPERIEERYLSTCFQELSTKGNLFGNKLPAYKTWITPNNFKFFHNYKFDGNSYRLSKTQRTTTFYKILNSYKNYLFVKSQNDLIVFQNKGNNFVKQNIISLNFLTNDDITSCACYENTLVISSSSNGEKYYVFDYITQSENILEIGTWKFIQSFNFPLSTGFGINVEMTKDHLLSFSKNNYVIDFYRDPEKGYLYNQIILPPNDEVRGFGESMSAYENELLIGAPMGNKSRIKDSGQGEVFHYFLSPRLKKWILISELGQLFNINSPAGNFGYSVKLNKDRAIVGCPGEAFYIDSRPDVELPNYGRAYIFKKNEYGYFAEKTTVYPLSTDLRSYKFFGSQVNITQNTAIVGMPYTLDRNDGRINIFNLDCLLPDASLHLTVPLSALEQNDQSGFLIDKQNEAHLTKILIPEIEISGGVIV